MRRKIWIAFMIICLAALLTGCFGEESSSGLMERIGQPIFHEPEQVTLKVYAEKHDWEQFVGRYGPQLEENFEHIKLQHVEAPMLNITEDAGINTRLVHEKNMMEQEIDLILGLSFPEWLIEEFLIALDAFIAEPSFEVEKIDSNLLDAQRAGDGRIYSLAPGFSSSALYYNKDLFDQYQVEYPRDYMSWEDIFYLGAQFPEHEVRGYQYRGIPSTLLLELLRTNKVELMDQQQRINVVYNDDFKDMLQQSLLYFKNYDNVNQILNDRISFEDGQVAMEIFPLGRIEREVVEFEWELVSRPIPPDGSKESGHISFQYMLSISTNTPHVEEAWNIISFINGEDVEVPYMEGDWYTSIPVRRSKFASESEKNYAHLYTMKPYYHEVIPDSGSFFGFGNAFFSVLDPIMNQILEKEISIEQGLIELENQAKALLHEW